MRIVSLDNITSTLPESNIEPAAMMLAGEDYRNVSSFLSLLHTINEREQVILTKQHGGVHHAD